MSTTKKILGLILTGLSILGIILIYATLRSSVFNLTLFSIGCSLALVCGGILFVITRAATKQAEGDFEQYVSKLKSEGTKIQVDLTKVEIKSNEWVEREEKYDHLPRVAFLNSVSGRGDANFENIQVSESALIFKTEIAGQQRTYASGPIAKDKTTLMMLLEMQRETTIYIDKNDPRNFYFDLEFLN